MKTNIFLLAVMAFMLALVSCGKDEGEDNVLPTATITNPVDGKTYVRGNPIIINGTFEDDKALSYCQVSLGNLKASYGIDTPWTPEPEAISLSGKEDQISELVFGETIPMDIWSGEYQLVVKVVDVAGNYNQYTFDIIID